MVVPESTMSTLPESVLEPDKKRPIPWVRLVVGLVVLGLAIYAPLYLTPSDNQTLSRVLYIAGAAMGLNLLTGFNGQISIGHGAFFGIGAFTTGILVVDHGWPLELTIPLGALLAAVVGVLIGFPALRVRGLYLALITLGLAVLFPRVASKYVDGLGGVALLQPSSQDRSSLIEGLDADQYQYYLTLFVVAILFILAWNLVRSRTGRAMISTRDQELAAQSVGINTSFTKVTTFALSAAFAGVAGSLSVMVTGVADATNPLVYFQLSIEFLIAVVIGGSATILGPLIGAAVLVFIQEQTTDLIEGKEILAPTVLGVALILIVYILPDGVVGGYRRLAGYAQRRSKARGTSPPPDPKTATTTPEPT